MKTITFHINKCDCFDEKTNTITIIQGNTLEFKAFIVDDETGENIVLGDNDVILWYIQTVSGKEVIKRIFTNEDTNEDGSINFTLKPMDTIDIKPSSNAYRYGLSYIVDNDDVYTYCIGRFIVTPSCGDINDLL